MSDNSLALLRFEACVHLDPAFITDELIANSYILHVHDSLFSLFCGHCYASIMNSLPSVNNPEDEVFENSNSITDPDEEGDVMPFPSVSFADEGQMLMDMRNTTLNPSDVE